MKQVLTQVKQYGVTPDEIRQAKLYLTGSYPLRLETNAGVAGQLTVAEEYGLGLNYIQKRADYYNAVTPAQVQAAIGKYLHPGHGGVLVIAGSLAAVGSMA